MKERFLTGLAIFFIALVVILTKIIVGTTIVADVFMGAILILSAIEMSNILKKQGKAIFSYLIIAFPIALFALLYVALLLKFSALWTIISVVLLLVVFMLISFFITIFSIARTENEMREHKIRTSKTSYAIKKSLHHLIGFIYPSLLLMFFMPLNHLAEINYLFNDSIANAGTVSVILCSLCLLIPFICDTFAYLIGKTFGGKQIAPKLSPKKTISGSIGGVVFTVLLIEAIFLILNSIPSMTTILVAMNLTWWNVLLIGFVGALLCELGDLFESFLKRRANIKDSGDLLPGHGGMLDRVDGLTFVIPFVFALMFVFAL